MSWKVAVWTELSGPLYNGLRFASAVEAQAWGGTLLGSWPLARRFEVQKSSKPVNYWLRDGRSLPEDETQAGNLNRVSRKISSLVLDFCRACLTDGGTFFARQLVDYVATAMEPESVAPNSPTRILQLMRQEGLLDYKVLNRRQSLYQVLSVGATVPEEA